MIWLAAFLLLVAVPTLAGVLSDAATARSSCPCPDCGVAR